MVFGVYQAVSLHKRGRYVMKPRKNWPRVSNHLLPGNKKIGFAMCSSTTRFRLRDLNDTE
jgi:hypothetical protein